MNKNKDKYLIVASSTQFIRGVNRTLVVDIRGSYFFITNQYCDLLRQYSKKKLGELLDSIEPDSMANLGLFIKYMQEREIVFFSDSPQWFPEMPDRLSNDYDHLIDSLIEVDEEVSDYTLIEETVSQLDNLRCKQVQLRLSYYSISYVKDILRIFDNSSISYLELRIKNSPELSKAYLHSIIYEFAFVTQIIVYEATTNEKEWLEFEKIEGFEKLHCGTIYHIKHPFPDPKRGCGSEISLQTMSFNNVSYFNRAKKYNSCLYKKVSVDSKWDIKNCLSMNKIYGNIKDTSLHDIIYTDEFKEMGHVKKDNIEICRDCEFRYNCNDCRAFVAKNAKPLGCQYDPYTSKWITEK